MIEVCSSRRSASRVDRISPVELEVLHILHTRYGSKPRAYIDDIDQDIVSTPENYPLLNEMDIRRRRWWIGHVLIQTGATKDNERGNSWRLKRE